MVKMKIRVRLNKKKNLQQFEIFFNRLDFGENPRPIVNSNSNLMSSSLWGQTGQSNTNPNSLLTCCAYESQLSIREEMIAKPESNRFTQLANVLNAKIIMSTSPFKF